MNTMTAHTPAGLTDPPRRDMYAAVAPVVLAGHRLRLPALPAGHRLREIASDTALLVALLAFVLAFVALRFTLLREPQFVEQVAIPVAAGAGVVSALALLCAFALRHGDARAS
jgi:hypothetical protein